MYTYIIVDDEPLIREGIVKQLEPLKDQLTCVGQADNGKTAIVMIAESHPDIAIIDMQMPIMDGTELLPYITAHFSGLQLVVISGYKDFDYIKYAIEADAIDYVLKPFSKKQIQDTVLKAINRLESSTALTNQIMTSEEQKEKAYYENDIQMLKNLILGYHHEPVAISSRKLTYINDTHNLVLLTLSTSQPVSGIDLQAHLEDIGFGNLSLYLPHLNNLHLGFIILFMPEHSLLRSEKLCVQITEELVSFMHNYQIKAYFGISLLHQSLKDLNQAYHESCYALNNRELLKPMHFYHFYTEEIEPKSISWDKTDEFLYRLEAGMTKEVVDLIDQLHDYYMTLPSLTLNDVKFHYYSLTNQCWPIITYYSKQYKPSSSMQNIVKSIFELDEIKEYYTRFFYNLAEMLRENSVYAVDDLIERTKIYIRRNYQKNLTVDLISDLFYMNPSYFSHLFRQKSGCKFVDYVNRTRIDKSKELLRLGNLKMYQIAKSVGYNNVKYFFRIFKKMEGMTPEQFRRSIG